MSTGTIENFLIGLGFEIDAKDLKSFKKEIEGTKDFMFKMVTAAGVAAAAIGGFVTIMAKATDELGDFAEQENVAVDMISELGHAAQLNGSSLEQVKSSISGINKVVGEAALGIGRGAKTFEKLHMTAKNADGSIKSVDDILGEVADKMQGLSRQEAIAMAEKLGIDRSLIPMLMKGKNAIAALRKEARELGAVTEKDAKIAGLYMDAMDRTTFMIKGLARGIATELMPSMTLMLNGMREWFKANREMIVQGIGKFISILSAVLQIFFDWTMRVVGALLKLVDWLTHTKLGLMAVAVAASILTRMAMYKAFGILASAIRLAWTSLTIFNVTLFITTAIVGGIILALIFLIDEIINFKEGNESFIGDLIKKYPQLAKVIDKISEAITAVWEYLKGLWNQLAPAMGRLGEACMKLFITLQPVLEVLWEITKVVLSVLLPVMLEGLAMIIKGWAMLFEIIIGALATFVDAIASTINWVVNTWNAGIAGIKNFFVGAFNFMLGVVEKLNAGIINAINFAYELVGLGPLLGADGKVIGGGPNPMYQEQALTMAPSSMMQRGGIGVAAGPGGGQSSTTTNSVQVQAPVTIVTSDPKEAGKSVSDHLNKVNRDAIRNSQSAVKL